MIGLGEVLWDVYPDGRHAGGAPANVALHAGQLGGRGLIVSAVGEDEPGRKLIEEIGRRGAVTDYIQISRDYPTGEVEVTLDDQGVPKFRCSHDTAFDHLAWYKELSQTAGTCDAVVVGTLAQRHPDSRQTIMRFLESAPGALKVFDVNFRTWQNNMEGLISSTLSACDIVKMNEEELIMMRQAWGRNGLAPREFLRRIMDKYDLRLAVLTLGKNGCILVNHDEILSIPGIETAVVDTTGCGDAFVAAMTIRILEGASLAETGEFANRVAAFTATRQGAVPAYTLKGGELK